jgi:hypothetical protein
MAKDWIEKNEWWLHWAIKLLYPVALFLGLAVGNLLIGYFGIETKVHASETYTNKAEQEKFNNKTVTALERLDRLNLTMSERQEIDRKQIVALNNKHGMPTVDYPLPK